MCCRLSSQHYTCDAQVFEDLSSFPFEPSTSETLELKTDSGVVGRLHLFKSVYRLGEEIIGTIDLSMATIPCLQVRVKLCLFNVYMHNMHVDGMYVHNIHVDDVYMYNMHVDGMYVYNMHVDGMYMHNMHVDDVYMYNMHVDGMYVYNMHVDGMYVHNMHVDGMYMHNMHVDGMYIFTKLGRVAKSKECLLGS